MSTTLLANVRLISPDTDLPLAHVWIEGARIVDVVEGKPPRHDCMVDLSGHLLMPGFFDIHSHGADGRDVCDNRLESIRHIAGKKLQEGVTTWLPTTLTQSQETLEEIAAKCAQYMANPEFCRTPGLHIEGPFINPENAGAQNPEFIRPPCWEELRRIHQIAPALILSIAPEMPGALEVISHAQAQGITSSAAHTSASAACIRDHKTAGLRHLTHFCNAMTPVHHREIGVVGAGLTDADLMLEIICDGIHLCPDMLRMIFQLVSIDRLMMITDSMAASWIDDGEVMLGGLEVIVRNGRAVLKHGGALAGSALRFNEGVRRIHEITGLPLAQIVKTTSWNQYRSLGMDGFGKIEPGFHADLVVMKPDFSVCNVMVDGSFRLG